MNASEGLMRVAMVVRWLGYLGAACIIGFVFLSGTLTMVDWLFLIPAAGVAIAGWVLAWIIEGFAKPKA